MVVGTAHRYNWVCLGSSANQMPDTGKMFDLSADVNKETGLTDSHVQLLSNVGYGNHDLLVNLLEAFTPDAVFIITDPRYWIWLFEMENEIRNKIPLIYLNIWDDLPAPLYNKSYYESCDGLICISKQTKNIVEMVLGDKKKDKVITYVPHGISEKYFHVIDSSDISSWNKFLEFKQKVFGDVEYKYVVFFNSRNITRKAAPTLLLAYQRFCEMIGPKESKKCLLIMHTDLVDPNGTDLVSVSELVIDSNNSNVKYSTGKLSAIEMNMLYNLCDVTVLPSSNEGWGLSLTESLIVGKMIIANVTGGMQDQMRFENDKGEWIDFTPAFCSNHFGTYKECGEWAIPVFPSNSSLVGSPLTPYIFDDRCDFRELAQAIKTVYDLDPKERKRRGEAGKAWVKSEEAKMTANQMCSSIIESIDKTMKEFKPRPKFELIKCEELPSNKLVHPITY